MRKNMKEITRIHLVSVPFNIEIEANNQLGDYIQDITKALGADKDAIREIELRIVELLEERGVKQDGIITIDDFNSIKTQLGDPVVFSDDEQISEEQSTEKPKKQLMRDLKNAKIGGVFAGLANYLNIDVSIVRIVGVSLIFFTAGFIIPIYIAIWLIVPAAKTAADRLIMSGQKVNLSTLKEESDIEPGQSTLFAKAARLLAIVGFLIGSIGAILAVLIANYMALFVWGYEISNIFMALMSIAGVALSILFGIITYSLITKSVNSKTLMMIVGIILIGVVSFASAMILTRSMQNNAYNEFTIDRTLEEADKLLGVKKIIVSADGLYIDYHVSDRNEVTLTYNNKFNQLPNIDFKREGDTLIISGQNSIKPEMSNQYTSYDSYLSVNGPVLESITVKANANVFYDNGEQMSLEISASDGSQITLSSSAVIDKLKANLTDGANLSAEDASIRSVDLTVEAREMATFGTISDLNLTSPRSCGAGSLSRISAEKAGQVTLNGGQILDLENRIECLEYNFNYNFY